MFGFCYTRLKIFGLACIWEMDLVPSFDLCRDFALSSWISNFHSLWWHNMSCHPKAYNHFSSWLEFIIFWTIRSDERDKQWPYIWYDEIADSFIHIGSQAWESAWETCTASTVCSNQDRLLSRNPKHQLEGQHKRKLLFVVQTKLAFRLQQIGMLGELSPIIKLANWAAGLPLKKRCSYE